MLRSSIKLIIAYIYSFAQRRLYRDKANRINKTIKKSGTFANSICNENIFSSIGEKQKYSRYQFYECISGIPSCNYIPEYIYYTRIEPCLNDKAFSKAYTDKNIYDKLIMKKSLPKTYFRSIKGVLYNENYEPVDLNWVERFFKTNEKFTIKISVDSGGGRGVGIYKKDEDFYIDCQNNTKLSFNEIIKTYGSDFICQETIENHPYYKKYNQTSLNTVRIFTYRSVTDEKVYVLHTILRVGKKGSIVDNQAAGGYACGVNELGELRGFAVTKDGKKHNKVNNISLSREEQIWGYTELRKQAILIAEKFHYARLLGLDFSVDNTGSIKLIEVNCVNNEINFYQFCNGPLFGDHTKEIIEFLSKNKSSYCFDFYI